ncbi:MAG: hypothetical protein ACREP9_17095 [Candidatus Dormibacteraceae bacterium]
MGVSLPVWKLIAGTACGIVAYKARQWGAGPQVTYAVWTLVGLAGSFYFSVLTDLISNAVKGRERTSTPIMEASRNLVTEILMAAVAVLIARFGQVPLLIFASEIHENVYLLGLLGLLWVALAVAAPVGAGAASSAAVESAHKIFDRSDRAIYGLLGVFVGLGMFALTGYLFYVGYKYGETVAIHMGVWPWSK